MAFGRPPQRLPRMRNAIALAAAAGAVLAVCGLAATKLFNQPTDLKFGVSVAAPVLVLLLARLDKPADALVPLVVFTAPFSALVFTVAGVSLSLFTVLLVSAAVCVVLESESDQNRTRSATGAGAVIALALLIPAVLAGREQSSELQLFGTAGLVGWLVASLSRRGRGRAYIVASIAASSTVQSAIAIYEFISKQQVNFYGSHGAAIATDYFYNFAGTDRSVGSFSDPISLGNVLAVSLPLILVAAVTSAGRRPWQAAGLALAALVSVVGLGVTLSRTSWIAAVVGVVVAALLAGRPWRLRLVTVVVVAGGLGIGVIARLAGPALGVRFASVFDPTASTVATAAGDRTREQLWHASERTFLSHPIFGVGVNNLHTKLAQQLANVGTFTHAHETYLQVAAEAGLPGIAALFVFFGSVARDLVASTATRVWRASLAGSTVALLVCFTTDYTIRYVAVAASMAPVFGLIAGLPRPPLKQPDVECTQADLAGAGRW